MWIHRVTLRDIVNIQKDGPRGLADSIYELIGAFRYYEAIDQWLAGNHDKAKEIASKVRTDKFTDTAMLLRVQARISHKHRQDDPFTDTCVAAHQQRVDWERMINGGTPEQLERATQRHEMYRQCQHELLPQEEHAVNA